MSLRAGVYPGRNMILHQCLDLMFREYLERWRLVPDGEAVSTSTSRLLPVRAGSVPAILKIALHEEEKRGNALMIWWAGRGSAPVLAHDGDTILMPRAEGGISLAELARNGRDDEASRIMCVVLDQLHVPGDRPVPHLVELAHWFASLHAVSQSLGGIFRLSASTASSLLENPREVVVLHGDMHHGNVLNFGTRGWLAIDPKGLIGERYFDYANIFCNPDCELAIAPGRIAKQVKAIAEAAHLEPTRLLSWVLAWAGLSAAFNLEDGLPAEGALKVAELAAAELNG
jgi:streptomycin 6-kinase